MFEAGAKEIASKAEACKKGLRLLMAEAKSIMERDLVITTNSFSIANIRGGDSEDRQIFQHPSALIRLAYLLMAIVREKKKSKTAKPFLANWISVDNGLCLSVGVTI